MQFKKILTFVLSFMFCLPAVVGVLSFAAPANALDPIIIKKATYSAPPPQQSPRKDVNFYSNDIGNYSVSCHLPITISQYFDPDCDKITGICRTQVIKRIEQTVWFSLNNYGNFWYRDTYNHFANRPKYIDDINFPKAMTTFDVDSPYGATNAHVRSTPASLQNCQKGQRLVQAVRSLTNKDTETYASVVNEAVTSFNGAPVRLVDIALALNSDSPLNPNTCLPDPGKKPIFYDPNISCFTSPEPIPFPGGVPSSYKGTSISPTEACRLFQRAVQVTDIGSNVRLVRVDDDEENADYDGDGVIDFAKKAYTSIPLGNLGTNKEVAQLLITTGQVVEPLDICQAITQVESPDKANRVSLDLVGIKEDPYFGIVTDEGKTFKRTFTRTFRIDVRVPETFATYKVALNNLLPSELQKEYSTINYPPSAIDNQTTLDPGNNIVHYVFRQFFWPAN
jgi:hypothetical protein